MLTDNKSLHQPTDTIEHDNYPDAHGPEPFPDDLAVLAELDRLFANERIPRKDPPKRPPSKTPIRGIHSLRRCQTPKGLVLSAENGAEIVTVPCRDCPGCRLWDQLLDVERIEEAIDPVVTIVTEGEWNATVQRIKRRNLDYMQIPLPNARRALIIDAAWDGPAEPVDDVQRLLASLDKKRDRTDGRRVSSGGLRSREAVERAVYATEEETPAEREVVGFWNTRMFAAVSHKITDAGEWLAAACDTAGAAFEPSNLGVIVTEHRHSPEAEKLWQMLKVRWLEHALPWYEGGPAPELPDAPGYESYWGAELGKGPTRKDEPPMSAYDAWIPLEVAV